MEIEFDPSKDAENHALRGLSFALVAEFEFSTALIAPDARFAYGEARMIAIGYVGARLHVVAYTMRGEVLRVISFRKANDREARRYAKARP